MIDTDALRERYEERAAILEFDANMSRPDAEREARRMVYGEESEK
jgi:hypothetical protein